MSNDGTDLWFWFSHGLRMGLSELVCKSPFLWTLILSCFEYWDEIIPLEY